MCHLPNAAASVSALKNTGVIQHQNWYIRHLFYQLLWLWWLFYLLLLLYLWLLSLIQQKGFLIPAAVPFLPQTWGKHQNWYGRHLFYLLLVISMIMLTRYLLWYLYYNNYILYYLFMIFIWYIKIIMHTYFFFNIL